MHEKLSKGLTFGLLGNVFFILFSLVCLAYYSIFGKEGIVVPFIEVIAYLCEAAGFVFMVLAVININRTVRMRTWLKISFPLYIAMELILMVLELNSYRIEFYKPYSLLLAIVHSVASAAVCFCFYSLDTGKKGLEITIIISVAVILSGMLGNILGFRIYFSILINAVAYLILFASVKWMLGRGTIEIDCHGDKARVTEYKSTFFGE